MNFKFKNLKKLWQEKYRRELKKRILEYQENLQNHQTEKRTAQPHF